MKFTVQRKILIGFGLVLAVVVLVTINNYSKMGNITDIENRLIELRLPTVTAGLELTDGIHLSLAGLRGYMILGGDPVLAKKFREERQQGWDLIDRAVQEMDDYSRNWTDPKNVQMLSSMKSKIEEFRIAQQEVEDISHSPKNIPAFNMLLTDAAPRASKILDAVTVMIDDESTLAATKERKKLLKLLADSRGSFAVGLANIRAFLLSGDSQYVSNFLAKWQVNEIRFQEVSAMTYLFTEKQTNAWNIYKTLRAEFAPLPHKMFELRDGKDWNLANYWLGTKAAPKATVILNILKDMRASQGALAETDKKVLASESDSMKTTMTLGTMIALGLGVFISIWVSRMISVPLRAVVARAKAIGDGDLTGVDLKSTGGDELTELTVAINAMSNSLKTMVKKIVDSSHQIGGSSEELSAITSQTSASISEQQSQTEQVATAMNEMNATVQEVTQNISITAQTAQDASAETDDGRQMVSDATKVIRLLEERISGTSLVISKLEKDSGEIGSVMDVIRSVAEQTNLLALNAAIEAARAGEQGRGFAVVADEVRALASRTQESTEEITQVIEKLQFGARDAVEVMSSSHAEVQTAVEHAEKSDSSLSNISSAVGRISDMCIQIASAAEQQNATTEEINRNITNISHAANENTEGAQQTAVASEELARLASGLHGLSRQFSI